MPKFHIA